MKKLFLILLTSMLIIMSVEGQFLTVAEKSDFKSTSNYADVNLFIDQLKKSSPYIRQETIGVTIEGKNIPLLIIGNPLPSSPKDLLKDKRIVMYIQANIHAGEVEGKEASLMFARDLLKEKNSEILKNVVVLICPLFNADGNEKISPKNRTYQNGPVNGVGVRYNGQFLDLNRDAMKAESPEVQGVITNVFNKWDPAIFMDCHTTDGSYHIEPTTFTWMVNPNGDKSLVSYMKERMMPEISHTLRLKYNIENCFYGEFLDMLDPEKGWILEASEPRYMSNYYGLRNRLGILNENYVYSDFKSRVYSCYWLIRSLSEYAAQNRSEIITMLADADRKTIEKGKNPAAIDSFAIDYDVRPMSEKVTIRTFEAELVADSSGRKSYHKTERQKDVTVPYYIDYYPTRSVKFPYVYILTAFDPAITGLLKLHGIQIEKLSAATLLMVQRFEVTDLKGSSRSNQGHYTDAINGKYVDEMIEFPAGTYIIRTAQRLGNLAAYLLEPQSNDGMVVWNLFDRMLVPQWGGGYNSFPVYKVLDKTEISSITVGLN